MQKILFMVLLSVGLLLTDMCLGQDKPTIDRAKKKKPKIEQPTSDPPKNPPGGKPGGGTSGVKNVKGNSGGKTAKKTVPFTVSPTSVYCSSNGGSYYFDVSGANDWHFSEETFSWGHLTKIGNNIKLIIDPSKETNTRSDKFKISNGKNELTVNITQGAAEAYISSDVSSLSFNEQISTKSIPVKSNATWTVKDYPSSWAKVRKLSDRVEITTEENTSIADRKTYITLAAGNKTKRVDISQAGRNPKFSVSHEEINMAASGGNSTITVNSDLSWNVSFKSVSWIDVQQIGNNIYLRVSNNFSTIGRNGYIEITDGRTKKVISVRQNGVSSTQGTYPNNKRREPSVRTFLGGKYQYGTFMGVGGTLGMYIYGVNVEGHYLTSIQQPKQIYWNSNTFTTNEQTAYQYKPTQYGGKLGYAIRLGKNFRLVPQAGVNVVSLKGTKMYGWGQDTNATDGYAVAAVGGLKLDIRFAKWVGISLTPEYSYPVQQSTLFKALSDNTNEIKKYAEGFNGCATLFFEF